jgi:predicted TIM-barrel fold metal-dependent hydrolase
MWASDFPHADHTAAYVDDLDGLVEGLPEDHRAAFLGGNARELFAIDA